MLFIFMLLSAVVVPELNWHPLPKTNQLGADFDSSEIAEGEKASHAQHLLGRIIRTPPPSMA